jgi:GNAT superfamily N-acetyltransferase
MPTYIKTYDLSKVWPPKDALNFCYRNNFDVYKKADDHEAGGLIKSQLKESLSEDKDYLIMAHDGNKWTGWAMAYKFGCRKEFQAYVPPRQRRKGIGSRLLKKACEIMGRVEVYDIDTSNGFYKSNGLTRGEAITGRKLKIK